MNKIKYSFYDKAVLVSLATSFLIVLLALNAYLAKYTVPCRCVGYNGDIVTFENEGSGIYYEYEIDDGTYYQTNRYYNVTFADNGTDTYDYDDIILKITPIE